MVSLVSLRATNIHHKECYDWPTVKMKWFVGEMNTTPTVMKTVWHHFINLYLIESCSVIYDAIAERKYIKFVSQMCARKSQLVQATVQTFHNIVKMEDFDCLIILSLKIGPEFSIYMLKLT